jgi:hypothetical protein
MQCTALYISRTVIGTRAGVAASRIGKTSRCMACRVFRCGFDVILVRGRPAVG